MLNRTRCVVLNATYEPLSVIDGRRAIRLLLAGKAVITESNPDQTIRAFDVISQRVTKKFPLPVQIRLNYHVKSRASRLPSQLTQRNLFTRDKYTCQFCKRRKRDLDKKEYLTRDHVIPITKGGKDVWKNVVTACVKCNNVKADHLMEDMTEVWFSYIEAAKRGSVEAGKTADWIEKHIVDAKLKTKVPSIVELWASANLKL